MDDQDRTRSGELSDEAWQVAVLSCVLTLHPERLTAAELPEGGCGSCPPSRSVSGSAGLVVVWSMSIRRRCASWLSTIQTRRSSGRPPVWQTSRSGSNSKTF